MTAYEIVTAAAVSTSHASYIGVNAADVACLNTTPAPAEPPANVGSGGVAALRR